MAAYAANLTKGPPNTINSPKAIKLAPDHEDISFILPVTQFIRFTPFLVI
jgi:hypothetical protein